MNHRSVALRLLAVFLSAGVVMTTGLVAASALSGSAADPAVVAVEEKLDADAAHPADQADDTAKDKTDHEGDDESDEVDSDDDADEAAPAGDNEGATHEGHGSEISQLARDTEPGREHGSVVCAAASGGKCQQDHQGTEADDDSDEGPSDGHGKGHEKADAARARHRRP